MPFSMDLIRSWIRSSWILARAVVRVMREAIPPTTAMIGRAKIRTEMVGSLLTITILLGTGFIVGWRSHTGFLEVVQAMLLLLAFASAMIWLGLWLGILVRSPDAVMGIGFVIVFPVTFLSNAFVPLQSLPNILQWVASVNPVSVLIAAVRTLFGNPVAPVTKHTWPLDHPVAAAWIYSIALVALGWIIAQRRYRARTTD